jgi:antitoxin component of MazEF toxin-antitoxin module
MGSQEHTVAKLRVRGGKLTVTLPEEIRDEIAAHDGDEIDVRTENGRIVLTPTAEQPLPGEIEALDEAEAEFAQGKTRRLDDILHGRVGRTTR